MEHLEAIKRYFGAKHFVSKTMIMLRFVTLYKLLASLLVKVGDVNVIVLIMTTKPTLGRLCQKQSNQTFCTLRLAENHYKNVNKQI